MDLLRILKKISDWKIKSIKKSSNIKYSILMSTDGISDDIIEEEMGNFYNELLKQKIDYKSKNNPILKKILKKWPNKYNLDDKTIVVVK